MEEPVKRLPESHSVAAPTFPELPKPARLTRGLPPGQEGLSRTAHRWIHAGRALNAVDQPFARRMAEMIRAHPVNDPSIREDPLEAAVFSLLIELLKE